MDQSWCIKQQQIDGLPLPPSMRKTWKVENFKMSEETKQKMRIIRRKRPLPSLETRLKISKALKGRMPKFIPNNKGRVRTPEHCKHLSEALKRIGHKPGRRPTREEINRGPKCNFWRGGVSTENERQRKSLEYRIWRKAVFERDNYTCIWCGIRGGTLHADHIKPFSLFPELRFAIDNGRTLCIACHKTTDTYGRNIFKVT
jgi:5-methylcytosine-specific restriction endonuclease McrA